MIYKAFMSDSKRKQIITNQLPKIQKTLNIKHELENYTDNRTCTKIINQRQKSFLADP